MGAGFSPLDEALALPAGGLTPQVQEWLVRLGAWVPFAQAAQLLAALSGVQISEATARRHAEVAGATYVAAQTAQAAPLAPPCDPGPATATRLQVSVDGAMVGLKGGQWAEVKTLVIGEVTAARERDGQAQVQTTALSYFSRLAPVDEFTRLSAVETHRRGVRAAAAVAGVVDGAAWTQSFLDFHCSDAVRILDFPHALEHVAAIGQAVWGDGTGAAAEWLAAQAHALKTTGPVDLLAEVGRWQAAHPEAEALREHGEYLRKRVAQMNYPAFMAAGWPIGSGIVESANKVVVEARLKGAGMRWTGPHVNALLGLRNAVCNDRWAEAWSLMAAQQRATTQARRRQRWQQRHAARLPTGGRSGAEPPAAVHAAPATRGPVPSKQAAPPTPVAAPPLSGPRRPAPNHPWRRSPIGKAWAA